MIAWWLLTLALGHAQAPPPEGGSDLVRPRDAALEAPAEPPPPLDDPVELRRFLEDGEVVHELTVYGNLEVEAARTQVLRTLADHGYTQVDDMGDYVRVRHPAVWKGEVHLHDDGWIRMKRQPVQFRSPKTPFGEAGSVASGIWCLAILPCLRTNGQLVAKGRYRAQEVRTLAEVNPEAIEFADRLADKKTGETINELPDALERLWEHGEPLDPKDGPLHTPAERKAALLAFWDSRTDTLWGDRVRVSVEAFVRAVVQDGPDAFTRDEIAAFNAERTCARALDLWSPWEDVTSDVTGGF